MVVTTIFTLVLVPVLFNMMMELQTYAGTRLRDYHDRRQGQRRLPFDVEPAPLATPQSESAEEPSQATGAA